ncbi:MAG: hypothetical protein ACREEX_06260, partial [Caulobacteraceae bacterium]
ATPAGDQARFWISRVGAAGAEGGLADVERYTPELAREIGFPSDDEGLREGWRRVAERLGAFRSIGFEEASPTRLALLIEAEPDRRWKVSIEVEDAPPHRLTRDWWERVHDFVLEVREARPEDWPHLCAIEKKTPIVSGGSRLFFDRGERWFDFKRLMEEAKVGLAFVDDEPAAMTCGARHACRIGGELKSLVTVSHLRILPEHQRKGLWGAVNQVLQPMFQGADGTSAYIAVDNAAMQHGFRSTPDKWPAPFVWARLETAALAGPDGEPAAGRPATSADAEAIVALLNAFHGAEELFVPYDAARLSARLARAPDLYSWENLLLGEGAVLGVWPAGRALRTITETEGAAPAANEPGVALDYAWRPGAEAAFEALLRAWCARLAAGGLETLSLYTSPGSPGFDLICSLAASTKDFNMWTPGTAVPKGAEARGLYIDPVYF